MKLASISVLLFGVATSAFAAAESIAPQADRAAYEAGLRQHFASQGDMCLGKFEWPIEVSAADTEMGSSNAVQMPVLEKLGLVTSTEGTGTRKVGEKDVEMPVRRYELTDAGRKYYLTKDTAMPNARGDLVERHKDFCAGRMSLDQVVAWTEPGHNGDKWESMVTYTFHFAPFDWMKDAEAQRVFPLVARMMRDEGKMKLKQRFRLVDGQWTTISPWE